MVQPFNAQTFHEQSDRAVALMQDMGVIYYELTTMNDDDTPHVLNQTLTDVERAMNTLAIFASQQRRKQGYVRPQNGVTRG